jgi:hypothetical protein
MPIPAGYTIHSSGFYFKDDASGPYSIDSAGVPHLLGSGGGGSGSGVAIGDSPTWTGTHTFDKDVLGKDGFAAGAATALDVGFYVDKLFTIHGTYGFLDNSTTNYTTVGLNSRSSFNSNVKIGGNQAIDHQHDYQAYNHYRGTGTLGRFSSFWAQPDIETGSGLVSEVSIFCGNDPLGTGPITNNIGLKLPALVRGANNWGFHISGSMPNYIGGSLCIGVALPVSSADVTIAKPNKTQVSGQANIYVYSTDAMAIDKGGSLAFGGSYTGSSPTTFARIAGRKLTGVADEIGGYLTLDASQNGVGMVSRMKISGSGEINTIGKFYPATPAMALQSNCAVYAGTGAPNNVEGSDGSFYFRSDGAAMSRIYMKLAGVWTGIV